MLVIYLCFFQMVNNIIFFFRWLERTSLLLITETCSVCLQLNRRIIFFSSRFFGSGYCPRLSAFLESLPVTSFCCTTGSSVCCTTHTSRSCSRGGASCSCGRDSSQFSGDAECSLCYVHCQGLSRSARQRRFTSLRPRPTGKYFLVHYIF